MTGQHKLASRYARALGELAEEADALEHVQADLARLAEAVQSDDQIRLVIHSERVPAAAKQELLLKLAGDDSHKLTQLFVRLLVQKRRAAYVEEMYDAFVAYADQVRGVVEIEIRSATPLGEAEVERLAEGLGAYTGKQVRITNVEAPEIMGGIVAQVGDLVIDGSVASRLARLKQTLQETRLGNVG